MGTYLSGPVAGGFTLAGSLSGASTTLADAGVDILTTIGKPEMQSNICRFCSFRQFK